MPAFPTTLRLSIPAAVLCPIALAAQIISYMTFPTDELGFPTGAAADMFRLLTAALLMTGLLVASVRRHLVTILGAILAAVLLTLLIEGVLWSLMFILAW